MGGKFNHAAMRGRWGFGKKLLCLFYGLCFALAGQGASAQEIKPLVKDLKTPVYQMFYAEKNETVIIAPTGAAENMKMMGAVSEQEVWRFNNRELVLWDVHYTYPGRNPTRPESVSFLFFVNQRKDRYRKNTGFSVSADGAVVQQGNYVVELRPVDENGKPVDRGEFTVTMPTEVFLGLARARKAELKFGSETFKLNGEQRAHIKVLAGTLEPLGK